MTTQPIRDKVLIEVEKKEKTASGVIIPRDDTIIEKAEVKAVGPDVKVTEVGDVILYKSWAVDNVEIDDEIYTFIDEDKILAKVKN